MTYNHRMEMRTRLFRSSILFIIGAGLAAYAALAFGAFMAAGRAILMLGSANPGIDATAQYAFTLLLLCGIFFGGAALIIFAVLDILRSIRK